TRFKAALHQARPFTQFSALQKVGNCGFPTPAHNRHLFSVPRVPADSSLYGSRFLGKNTPNNGEIRTIQTV
mgnify:CR=1